MRALVLPSCTQVSGVLHCGAHVCRTRDGWSAWEALHFAAQANRLDVIVLLLAQGAQVDQATRYAETPLCMASVRGHVEIVTVLAANGASVNRVYSDMTPLWVACEDGNDAMVQALLAYHADTKWARRSDGATPLSTAFTNGHHEIVRMLQGFDEYVESHPRRQRALLCLLKQEGLLNVSTDLLLPIAIHMGVCWPPV